MTVGELMHRMSRDELIYWYAWSNLKHDEHRQRELDQRAHAHLNERKRG